MAGLSSFPGRAVFQQLVQDSVQTAGIVIVLIVARVYSTGFRLTMKEWPARIAVRRAVDGYKLVVWQRVTFLARIVRL